ncbi:MAG: hypothetical protein JOZ01_09380, partial [Candidatus Eremiobacteraeota bacterium]|nr:hypothetical protein [Candidatus Eremiobacteraeota bacterium]
MEWLRVRGVLRWTAIVLIGAAVVTLVARLTLLTPASSGPYAIIQKVESDPRSRVVVTMLPDGTKRTTVDNPNGPVHVVIDDRGYQGKHIEITQPSGGDLTGRDISMPWFNLESHTTEGRTTAVIVTAPPQSFGLYAGFAAFIALIVATVLGAPFARENNGHLEIALTKPIGRRALVLATMGVDLFGIFAAWIAGILFLIAVQAMFYSFPHLIFDGQAA